VWIHNLFKDAQKVCSFNKRLIHPCQLLIAFQGSDWIEGGKGNDDLYGGHNVRFGEDSNDTLKGGDQDDVVLGDNGEIIRKRIKSAPGNYPWVHESNWSTYSMPFDQSVIRDTRRYDDIDFVEVSKKSSSGEINFFDEIE
jgi:hypothetical protein